MPANNNFVPLPQVSERSELINIHELGLPVGLDIERLELNVPQTERIMRYGDIGSVCVFGYRGDTTERDFSVGSMSADGSATAAGSVVGKKAKTHDSEVMPTIRTNIQELTSNYDWKHAHVKINNAEIEDRIRLDGDKWDRGPYDVFARAKYINRSLKSGLKDAAKESILGERPGSAVLWSIAKENMYLILTQLGTGLDLPESLALVTAWQGVLSALAHHTIHNQLGDMTPKRQLSLARRVHYDRLAVSTTLATTSKLIRARK